MKTNPHNDYSVEIMAIRHRSEGIHYSRRSWDMKTDLFENTSSMALLYDKYNST